MFTGIIQDIGEVTSIDKKGDWTIMIATNKYPLERTAIGASIACNGICLTVIEKGTARSQKSDRVWFKVQLSAETLARSTAKNWVEGTEINLEPALRMGDELGGHLVSGHVDGLAKLIEKHNDKDSLRYIFQVPHEFVSFLAQKGSITLNGVSLTVNEVENDRFGVNIIPHTQIETTFGSLGPGDEVNFEVDLMARYAARLMGSRT